MADNTAIFKMADKVLRLEDVLNVKKTEKTTEKRKNIKKRKKNENKEVLPEGKRISGRVWKDKKKRFSSIIKTPGIKLANKFEKLLKRKEDVNRVRELTRSLKEAHKAKIEEKKERRRNNLKKQEENRLKAEVVQVIKDTAKIKRMRKKQLRNIEKRDTLKMKQQGKKS